MARSKSTERPPLPALEPRVCTGVDVHEDASMPPLTPCKALVHTPGGLCRKHAAEAERQRQLAECLAPGWQRVVEPRGGRKRKPREARKAEPLPSPESRPVVAPPPRAPAVKSAEEIRERFASGLGWTRR
jgi:hypothetical protein